MQTVQISNIKNTQVFCRVDFDVPLKKGEIQNTYRIDRCLDTIKILLENNNKIILFTKLGRPKNKEKELSARNLLYYLNKTLKKEVIFIRELNQIKNFKDNLGLFENTRFFKWERELNKEVAKEISNHFDIYVDEAFAMSHRTETTNYLVPQYIGKVSLGKNYQKELSYLNKIKKGEFKKPGTFILGGSKPETKIPMINSLLPTFDYFLIGGLLVKNLSINNPKIIKAYLDKTGFDITQSSIEMFKEIIKESSSLVFNGPVGKFEEKEHSKGTYKIIESIVKSKAELKIAGGGDTINAINHLNPKFLKEFTFISTGGGAMFNLLGKGKTNLEKLKIPLS